MPKTYGEMHIGQQQVGHLVSKNNWFPGGQVARFFVLTIHFASVFNTFCSFSYVFSYVFCDSVVGLLWFWIVPGGRASMGRLPARNAFQCWPTPYQFGAVKLRILKYNVARGLVGPAHTEKHVKNQKTKQTKDRAKTTIIRLWSVDWLGILGFFGFFGFFQWFSLCSMEYVLVSFGCLVFPMVLDLSVCLFPTGLKPSIPSKSTDQTLRK